MPIVFMCEWCGRPISAEPELAGGTMSCPGCAAALHVPVPVLASIAVPPPLSRGAPQFFYPAPPQSKGTGLATLSLLLGIVGLVPCLCMIPNLFAVVFGMSALRTGTTSPATARSGVVLGMTGVLIGAIFWGFVATRKPPPDIGRPETPQDICQNSLRSLAKEVERYKREHDGAFPPDMETLKGGERVYWAVGCPENKSKDTEPDYLYAPPAEPILGTTIACDAAGRHQGGRNVLHASGHVTFVSAEDFAREMRASRNRALAQVLSDSRSSGQGRARAVQCRANGNTLIEMQEISLKCEWCGQATVAPAELLGKSIPCPGCSAPLSVQEVVVATIAPAAAVQTPTRSQRWATASTQQSPTGRATRIQSNLMTTLAAHFSWLAPLAAYGLFFLQFALPREVAYKFGAEVFFGVPTMLTILGAVIGSTSAWAVRRQGRKGLFWLALAGVLLSLLPWLLFGAFLLAIMISHPNGISL